MNITTFYNHSSLISDAKKGASIIAGEKPGTETNSFRVGDSVCSTGLSRYAFKKGVIIEQYNQNGYFYHIVMIGKKTEITVRTKDIKRL